MPNASIGRIGTKSSLCDQAAPKLAHRKRAARTAIATRVNQCWSMDFLNEKLAEVLERVRQERGSLAATAALFCPPAHSRMMRARKARVRELRGCCNSCLKAIIRPGLTTRSRFLGRPRGF